MDWLLLRRRMMMTAIKNEAYIIFVDPVVEQICATNWGDGVGITPSQASQVTSFGSVFRGNTSITSFNEMEYFTGMTSIASHAFDGCTYLTEVTLPPNLTAIASYGFYNCSRLANVSFNGTGNFSVAEYAFRYCSALVSFPTIHISVTTGQYVFYRHKMTYMEFNNTISSISSRAFISLLAAGTPQTIIMRNTTPPSLGNNQVFMRDNGIGSFYINTGMKIYVPYSADQSILNAYKTKTNWTTYANYIFELDENGNIPT